jgi:hypothetical protein
MHENSFLSLRCTVQTANMQDRNDSFQQIVCCRVIIQFQRIRQTKSESILIEGPPPYIHLPGEFGMYGMHFSHHSVRNIVKTDSYIVHGCCVPGFGDS